MPEIAKHPPQNIKTRSQCFKELGNLLYCHSKAKICEITGETEYYMINPTLVEILLSGKLPNRDDC